MAVDAAVAMHPTGMHSCFDLSLELHYFVTRMSTRLKVHGICVSMPVLNFGCLKLQKVGLGDRLVFY